MMVKDGEKALWVTERSQLPSGEWRIMVWLNTKDSGLSHSIHQDIATVARARMEEAARVGSDTELTGEQSSPAQASK